MKIGERLRWERIGNDENIGDLSIHQRHDLTGALERARAAREIGQVPMSDAVHVGTIPAVVVREWCRQAGVSMDDADAVSDVVMRNLHSGEFAKFRVKEGNYQ